MALVYLKTVTYTSAAGIHQPARTPTVLWAKRSTPLFCALRGAQVRGGSDTDGVPSVPIDRYTGTFSVFSAQSQARSFLYHV